MSSTNESDTQPGLQWNSSIDKMMANWCDQSKCFNWMHTQGYSRYSARATAMNISTNIFISLEVDAHNENKVLLSIEQKQIK